MTAFNSPSLDCVSLPYRSALLFFLPEISRIIIENAIRISENSGEKYPTMMKEMTGKMIATKT